MMLKLKGAIFTAMLGALAFAPGLQAGGFSPDAIYECDASGDTHVKDTFCDGGRLYEVKVNCLNLEGGIDGGLAIDRNPSGGPYTPVGQWAFLVRQNTDDVAEYVCDADGYYGDLLKTEMKCTDAPTGSNKCKPGVGNQVGCDFYQADFEIKDIGACP